MMDWCWMKIFPWKQSRVSRSWAVTAWHLLLSLKLLTMDGASADFNLFMSRREVKSLIGLPSDIYLVTEGVINEYALGFVVNVPANREELHFTWQSLSKRPVHYELVIEFSDFFALLQPSSNISSVGRVPQKQETFTIWLPCSGRMTAEIDVIIRFTFNIRYEPKPVLTEVDVRRNKICLKSEGNGKNGVGRSKNDRDMAAEDKGKSLSASILDQPPPSLLLAGLLGGCAVTGSAVFLTFFMCVRRKLLLPAPNPYPNARHKLPCENGKSGGTGEHRCESDDDDENHEDCDNSSSPACLLRSGGVGGANSTACGYHDRALDDQWVVAPSSKHSCASCLEGAKKSRGSTSSFGHHNHPPGPPPSSRRTSRSSYLTITSLWNDIFSTSNAGAAAPVACHQRMSQPCSSAQNNSSCNSSNTTSNSNSSGKNQTEDVSPYAYAHIVPPSQVPLKNIVTFTSNGATNPAGANVMISKNNQLFSHVPPTPPPLQKPPPPPPLIEWYSQSPCKQANVYRSNDPNSHIYSNSLYTFSPHGSSPMKGSKQDSCDNLSTTGRSVADSIVQIDGFQTRRTFVNDAENAVERFL